MAGNASNHQQTESEIMTLKSADSSCAPFFRSCCGCEASAWVRGAADDTAAGPFPAFSFYRQTAHLCLFDITHMERKGERHLARQIGSLTDS